MSACRFASNTSCNPTFNSCETFSRIRNLLYRSRQHQFFHKSAANLETLFCKFQRSSLQFCRRLQEKDNLLPTNSLPGDARLCAYKCSRRWPRRNLLRQPFYRKKTPLTTALAPPVRVTLILTWPEIPHTR